MKALTILGAILAHSVVSSAGAVRPRADSLGNPFDGMRQLVNPDYAELVEASAQCFLGNNEVELARKALQIKENNPSWTWLDKNYKAAQVTEYLQMITDSGEGGVIATFVIYNLPARECGTTKPHGEFENDANGKTRYRKFIDTIAANVAALNSIPVAFIIEPEAITNLVEFKDDPRCAAAEPMYKELIAYAIKTLAAQPKASLYLDGGNSASLGAEDRISEVVTLATDIYKEAGSPGRLRGLSVNVGRYNAWSLDSCADSTSGNCDEKRYIKALAPLLTTGGWADPHFIIDQSRAGVPPTEGANLQRTCNIMGTGFGIPPGAGTGEPLADSFVWAKPGGRSDGTSVGSSANYDSNCDAVESFKPSPEYGHWFTDYFKQLIVNANPPIVAST